MNSKTASPAEISRIAERCHEANRRHRRGLNEDPGPRWQDASSEMKLSAIEGVKKALDGATPEQLHESWLKFKADNGWTLGERDDEKKTHPCMVPYDQLPEGQKQKDALFHRSVENGVKELLRDRRAEIAPLFTYHAPKGDQPGRYVILRDAARAFAEAIIENTAKGADQSAALRKVREAVMTANASIALENVEDA